MLVSTCEYYMAALKLIFETVSNFPLCRTKKSPISRIAYDCSSFTLIMAFIQLNPDIYIPDS